MFTQLHHRSTELQSLTLEALQHNVPSIFTEDSAARTSDKYQHISTAKVLDGLLAEGFLPTWASQCKSRLSAKEAYTKHMLRLRHINAQPTASGLYPEIVLVNSHDGLSSYRLMSGVYRMVCANGLIAGNSYDEIRVRHQGDIVNDVIEGTYIVIDNAQKMIDTASQMSSIQLAEPEKLLFAEAARTIRFDDDTVAESFEPSKFLRPRRYAEHNKNDLFTIFNIVQENIIKGGVRGHSRDHRGYIKRTSTRAITSIDQNTKLNKALWTLAEKMMHMRQ